MTAFVKIASQLDERARREERQRLGMPLDFDTIFAKIMVLL